MKTNDTSMRALALKWFKSISKRKQAGLVLRHLPNRPKGFTVKMLTGREIEEIWKKELSSEWWESLTYKQKDQYRGFLDKYTSMDSPVDPVQFADESMIAEIWLSEVINEQQPESIEKPNRKQFKEFSPELFKAYIDKFSDEDKVKALDILETGIGKETLIERELVKLESNV
jgi:hypothetical protein